MSYNGNIFHNIDLVLPVVWDIMTLIWVHCCGSLFPFLLCIGDKPNRAKQCTFQHKTSEEKTKHNILKLWWQMGQENILVYRLICFFFKLDEMRRKFKGVLHAYWKCTNCCWWNPSQRAGAAEFGCFLGLANQWSFQWSETPWFSCDVIVMVAATWSAKWPGPCITNVIATCRKNFSQWERSFLWKLRCHWLKFLRRVAKTLVIQGPVTSHNKTHEHTNNVQDSLVALHLFCTPPTPSSTHTHARYNAI